MPGSWSEATELHNGAQFARRPAQARTPPRAAAATGPPGMDEVVCTHRPLSSSFLGVPDRILNINHKKEQLRGLWVSGPSDA